MLLNKIRKYIILSKYYFKYPNCVKIGKNINFRKNFEIIIEQNGKVNIGDRCFFNNYCSINSLENISIGNDCIFGENVKIYDHNHKFNNKKKLIKKQGYKKRAITIGNNCWIGSNVIILKGVNIGDNVVIGANCLIKNDIPNDSLVECDIKNIITSIKYK